MTLFGAPLGTKPSNKYRLLGFYTNPHEAKRDAQTMKDNGHAKQTRIDKIGGHYVVNFVPTSNQRRRMKGPDYNPVDYRDVMRYD